MLALSGLNNKAFFNNLLCLSGPNYIFLKNFFASYIYKKIFKHY